MTEPHQSSLRTGSMGEGEGEGMVERQTPRRAGAGCPRGGKAEDARLARASVVDVV